MKRKYILIGAFTAALLAVVLLIAFGGGNTKTVERQVGDSQIYTPEEIGSAMDIAEGHFRREFEGCTLLTLTYEEDFSERLASGWADNYDVEEAIVLYSSFWVDGSRADGSFNPSSLYTKWQWILTRSNGGNWKLQTWGYG